MTTSLTLLKASNPVFVGSGRTSARGALASAVCLSLALLPLASASAQDSQISNTQPPTPQPSRETVMVELPSPLSLGQAIEIALQLQPNIATAAASVDRAEAQERGARARYFPNLSPQYTYLNQYNFGTVNQFLGNGVVVPIQQGSTRTNKQAQMILSYRLWDSGSRDYSARQARQSLRVQQYGEENTRQSVVATVADAYFNVLRNDALVSVSRAQVDRAKNTLDVITAQADVGTAARKDILQAQADYFNAQVNLLTAQNNAALAQANLKSAIGLIGGEPLKVSAVPAPTATTPVTATVQGVEQSAFETFGAEDATVLGLLTQAAFQSRPDVAQSAQNVEVSKTSVKLSQINAGLLVNADVSASELLNPNDFDRSIGQNRQMNVSVSYPLFDGGNARSQVRANKASVRVAEGQLATLKQQIAVEVEQSYRNLVVARAAIPAAEAAQQAAQINYDAALASQKEGVGSIVEVITAQTSLVQAQTNYVQAIYNFYAADARLARAVGQADRIGGIGQTTPPPP